jgi:type II secretory pathway pseudopilin PulG
MGQPYQQQYYPPPKKGMPGWAWALIGCGGLFVVFIIVGILALAAIPLITANTRDARRAEGEHLMGSMRNHARVAYARTDTPPRTLMGDYDQGGSNVAPADLHGMYYSVRNSIGAPSDSRGELVCDPQESGSDGIGRMNFSWYDSAYDIRWE